VYPHGEQLGYNPHPVM